MIDNIDDINNKINELKKAQDEHKMAAEAIGEEITQLTSKLDDILDGLRDEMLSDGVMEEVRNGVKFKLRKLPQKIEVLCNPEMLPDEYKRVKTTVTADKAKLKKDVKAGLATNYARLSDVEYKLEIKHEV